MGSESSLNQSKIRSSVDLLGREVREERLVIKGLSNKMGVRTQCTNSLGFKWVLFTMSGVWWFMEHTAPDVQHLLSSEGRVTPCATNCSTCPWFSRKALFVLWLSVNFPRDSEQIWVWSENKFVFDLRCIIERWGVVGGLPGLHWEQVWKLMFPGVRACTAPPKAQQKFRAPYIPVRSWAVSSQEEESWAECVWWDVCVLKHVRSAGLLQHSGYFTPVITLSSWRIHGPGSRWIALRFH